MVNELHAKQAWLKEQDKLSPYRPALGDDDVARHIQRKTWGGYPHRRKKSN